MTTTTGQGGIQSSIRKQISVSFEVLICAAIALAAILLRWISLGAAPLSADEARQAMAAWHMIAPGSAPGTGAIDSILVFAGTVASFAISSPGDAAARLASALGGAGLALSPLLFRSRLGRTGTILCMAILAVSPSAVVTSRQMTGVGLSMLGIVAMLAAVDGYLSSTDKRFAVLAGISLAVALLADFGSIAVLLMLAAGTALALITVEDDELADTSLLTVMSGFPWSAAAIGLGTTVLLLGTLFYLAPNGLGAAADQVARFFGGLVSRPANTPYLGLVILVYEPFLLVFGLIGAWFASQSSLAWQRFLAGWGIASVVISLLYPGALPVHSLWCVIPLGALSALLLDELLSPVARTPTWAVIVQAAGTVALIAMIVGSLARQLRAPQVIPLSPDGTGLQYNLLLIAMWIILSIVAWLTVASIWGRTAAWHGFGLGFASAGLMLAFGLSAALAFTRPTSPFELFNQSPADPTLAILVRTAEDVSVISAHDRHDATITIQADPNSALAWALRDFHNVNYVTGVEASIQSVMVITPVEGDQPNLGSNYVGQSFVVTRQWPVAGMDFPRFVVWLIYRTADPGSVQQERVILWVREDVYRLAPDKSVTP